MYRLEDLPTYTPLTVNPDWHDTQTIQLGELMEAGFDPYADPDWADAGWYNEETRTRVEKKITKYYKYYEISITPPGKWRDMLTARALLVVPKYAGWYAALEKGINPMYDADTWTKNRSLYSDFPATRLNPQLEDYASTATDYQGETVSAGNLADAADRLARYRDADNALVDEFHVLFSQLAEPITEW